MELLMAYAKGKHAKFISDRSGLEYPYTEMVKEWNGMRVHTSEYEAKAPQLMPQEHEPDPIALQNARPARTEPATERLLGLNPFSFTASSTTVTVNAPSHGFTTSDTIRFRDVGAPLLGASESELETASGFSLSASTITDDSFTVVVTTAPGLTGFGGGGMASVGPVTLSS